MPRHESAGVASGGTVTGNLTITGNLTVQGTTTSVVNQTTTGTLTITKTSATALVVEDDSNVDSLNVNTTAGVTTISGPALTTGGTDDKSLSVTRTLNDSGAAGGSDKFTLIQGNITETDVTGWDNVYLMDLQVGGTSLMSFDNAASLTIGDSGNAGSIKLKDSGGTARTVVEMSGNTISFGNGSPAQLQFKTAATGSSIAAFDMVAAANAASSGTGYGIDLNFTVNQSGTAAYTALLIDVTETATGSGAKLVQDWQVGGSSVINIDNAGQITCDPGGTFGNTTGLMFGDGDTGLYESSDDNLSLISGGVEQVQLNVTGNHIVNSLLDAATGNEAALSLNYTTNKLTSGNDTGLVINQTDTLSPGTSLLLDLQVGGVPSYSFGPALLTFADAVNMAFNTTTGTQIGTATTQKIGFFGVTPVVQQPTIVDADGTLADVTSKFNTALSQLEAIGLFASV